METHIDLGAPSEHSGLIISGERGSVDISSTRSLITIHARPIVPTVGEFPHREPSLNESKTAVVVQGPIVEDCQFTINTLTLYRKIFPVSPIILSTWDDSPREVLADAERLGCHVLRIPKPSDTGWGNVDLQIASTSAGINFAGELGSTHVIKTRTDFRIHRGDTITNLLGWITTFPIEDEGKQAARIVVTDLATLKHRPYGLTDIFQFGTLQDMSSYWSPETYGASIQDLSKEFGVPPIIDGVPLVAEIFLCWRFLKSLGYELDFTLDDWWMHLRGRFSIVDVAALDGFWFKHDWHWEYRFGHSYSSRGPLSVSCLDWISLHSFGVPESWRVNGFREEWARGVIPGLPSAGGITQISH